MLTLTEPQRRDVLEQVLAAIKKKYDPKNVLRLNQNIKPG